jgi:uncharacterized protein YbjT (DUF2867 family)
MDSPTTHPVKRILILGANGQLGSLFQQYLTAHLPEAETIGCVRKRKNVSGNYIAFDPFTDDWQKLGKADVLINCIGIIQETAEITFEKVHEDITLLLLENRQLIGNPRIIQISALGAATNSVVPFLRTKGKADKLLQKHAETVVIRPSIVCTPNTIMIQKLRLHHRISKFALGCLPFPSSLLSTRIQPIMPDDLVAIVARVCLVENPPSLIHAVGPTALSLGQLIELSTLQNVHLIKVSQKISDIAATLISFLFPRLLTQEQYQLLQTDNTYHAAETENILGRQPLSTEMFWRNAIYPSL